MSQAAQTVGKTGAVIVAALMQAFAGIAFAVVLIALLFLVFGNGRGGWTIWVFFAGAIAFTCGCASASAWLQKRSVRFAWPASGLLFLSGFLAVALWVWLVLSSLGGD